MIIRRAKIEDQDVVIELVVEAIENLSNIFTGYEENSLAKKKLKDLYSLSKNRFSYDSCLVAEIDGEVAGSIMAYPGVEMKKLNEPLIEKLKERFKDNEEVFREFSQAIQESKEAFDDEYYIDNLAVVAKYRGRGISRALIEEAEKEGFTQGYNRISILADINNEKAFSIYKKMGYVEDCELAVLGHTYHHLVKTL